MRLYKLIGLEIEALQAEHETTLKNIAKYEDILNNYDSMANVIIEDLEAIRKEYGRERRTVIENAEEAIFEEKKIEEQDVVLLMDRFGYTRTVEPSVYERNKEAADLESKYVVSCLNTGKVCMFTNTGKMHQVKVLDIPFGKFRDKGTPIDNMSNFNSAEEEIVFICDENQFRIATLLFATKQGVVKKVSGEEFLVGKRTIAATKLNDGDELLSVQIINAKQSVVIQTQGGYFLRFHGSEISEMKKTAAGVKGIKLQKNDVVENVYLYEEGKETKVMYKDKELTLNRLKQSSRGGSGNKQRG
jgi:DNA gyrase subunit A